MLRIIIPTFLLLFFLLPAAAAASDCECKDVSLEYALENATAVFIGRVDEQKPSGFKPEYQEVKFVVFKRFKGFEELPNLQFAVVLTRLPEQQEEPAGSGTGRTD